jgi:DNA-binding response OmpR family regulator
MRNCRTINVSERAYSRLLEEVTKTGRSLVSLASEHLLRALGEEPDSPDESEPSSAAKSLVVNEVQMTIEVDGEVLDMSRKHVLRKFLHFLAARAGELLTKEQVVVAVWGVDYHPLRHDAGLFSLVQRARQLLRDPRAEVLRGAEGGYVFEPPADFRHVRQP